MGVYDYTVKDQNGQDISLADYRGKVLLIVNTATHCGFTPQYKELEELYEKYKEQGFVILDFPCNQFAGQAPGSDEEIANFCEIRYSVAFPQFHKIEVNGKNEDPLYTFLKSQNGGRIKWNFTKFLIDRNGNVVDRFGPPKKPDGIAKEIEELL